MTISAKWSNVTGPLLLAIYFSYNSFVQASATHAFTRRFEARLVRLVHLNRRSGREVNFRSQQRLRHHQHKLCSGDAKVYTATQSYNI